MKKIHSFLTLFFLVIGLFTSEAQIELGGFNFSLGKDLPKTDGDLLKIVGNKEGYMYGLATKKEKRYYINIYDEDTFELKINKLLNLKEINTSDKLEFENMFMIDGEIYLFATSLNKSKKRHALYAFHITKYGTLNPDPILVEEKYFESRSDQSQYYLREHPELNALILVSAINFKRENQLDFQINLIDKNLKKDLSFDDKISLGDNYAEASFKIEDFEITSKKDAYMVLNKSYRDSKNKTWHEEFKVYAWKKESDYQKEIIDVEFSDYCIENALMLFTEDDFLKINGFYASVDAKGRSNQGVQGFYNLSIDLRTNEIVNLIFSEVPEETKNDLIGEKATKKGKTLPHEYFMHSVFQKPDGGTLVVAELQEIYDDLGLALGPVAVSTIRFDFD